MIDAKVIKEMIKNGPLFNTAIIFFLRILLLNICYCLAILLEKNEISQHVWNLLEIIYWVTTSIECLFVLYIVWFFFSIPVIITKMNEEKRFSFIEGHFNRRYCKDGTKSICFFVSEQDFLVLMNWYAINEEENQRFETYKKEIK